jgi:hypothetical protein
MRKRNASHWRPIILANGEGIACRVVHVRILCSGSGENKAADMGISRENSLTGLLASLCMNITRLGNRVGESVRRLAERDGRGRIDALRIGQRPDGHPLVCWAADAPE